MGEGQEREEEIEMITGGRRRRCGEFEISNRHRNYEVRDWHPTKTINHSGLRAAAAKSGHARPLQSSIGKLRTARAGMAAARGLLVWVPVVRPASLMLWSNAGRQL